MSVQPIHCNHALNWDSSHDATLEELESNANCVLYTYGVGPSQKQAMPPYILELAHENPSMTYELIHCDTAFSTSDRMAFPPCLSNRDWQRITYQESHTVVYRHKQFSNLTAKLISKNFPTNESFDLQFQNYLDSRLKQGAEIFLGVHNECFMDGSSCMGESYNKLRKTYLGRIHFYTQASDVPAFVYKGPYNPFVGALACSCCFVHSQRPLWLDFQRCFSQSNPPEDCIDKVRAAYKDFLTSATLYNFLPTRTLRAPNENNPEDYLNNPLENRLITIPIQQITAQMWKADPGKEVLPKHVALHRYYPYGRPYWIPMAAFVATIYVVGIALLSRHFLKS